MRQLRTAVRQAIYTLAARASVSLCRSIAKRPIKEQTPQTLHGGVSGLPRPEGLDAAATGSVAQLEVDSPEILCNVKKDEQRLRRKPGLWKLRTHGGGHQDRAALG